MGSPGTAFWLCVFGLIRIAYWAFLWDIPPDYGPLRVAQLCALGAAADFLAVLVIRLCAWALAAATRRRLKKDHVFHALAAAFLFFYLVDCEVYRLYLTHIGVSDLSRAGDFSSWSSILYGRLYLLPLFLGSIGLAAALTRGLTRARVWRPRPARALYLSFCLLATSMGTVWGAHYVTVPDRGYRLGYDLATNILLFNARTLARQERADAAWTEEDAARVREFVRVHGPSGQAPARPRDTARVTKVILVIMESLSSSDSVLFKGGRDLLPELDSLAREGAYYTDFHAAGAGSINCLIPLTTGLLPYLEREHGPFMRSLAAYSYPSYFEALERHGFSSVYLHNGSLLFERQKAFLRTVGCDRILDREDFSPDLKEYGWGPSDRQLFRKAVEMLEAARDERQFLVLASITNHAPFDLPDEKYRVHEDPYKNTTLYSDAAFAEFYGELRRRGFLDDTLLIVTGDHFGRGRPEYTADSGLDYETRVPLVIWEPLGRIAKGEDSRPAGHIDIGPTIMDYLGLEAGFSFLGRSLLGRGAGGRTLFTRDWNRKIVLRRGRARIDLFYDGTRDAFRVRHDGKYMLTPEGPGDACAWAEEAERFLESYNRLLLGDRMSALAADL